MPRVDELIENIVNNTVFTTIDLKHAYHQVALKPEEYHLTAFEALNRLYEFKRLPFGCTNAVPIFQRTMDNLIKTNNLQINVRFS